MSEAACELFNLAHDQAIMMMKGPICMPMQEFFQPIGLRAYMPAHICSTMLRIRYGINAIPDLL